MAPPDPTTPPQLAHSSLVQSAQQLNADNVSFTSSRASSINADKSSLDFSSTSPANHSGLPARWALYCKELSGDVPVNSTLLREYPSSEEAFNDAKAFADNKKAELAGKDPWTDLDVHTDTIGRSHTVSVAYVLRFRYQVESIHDAAGTETQEVQESVPQKTLELQGDTQGTTVHSDSSSVIDASPKPKRGQLDGPPITEPPSEFLPETNSLLRRSSSGLNDYYRPLVFQKQQSEQHIAVQSEGERHDTPVLSDGGQAPTSEDIMNIKQEQGATPPASIHNCPTPAPDDGNAPCGGAQDTNTTPIEIHDEDAQLPYDGDAAADEDGHSNDGIAVEQSSATVSEFPVESFKATSTQQAIKEVVEPEAGTTNQNNLEAEGSSALLPEPASEPRKDYGHKYFGLYITMVNPPTPAVTYRIQLNTSLGQAQSDMRVIASNEVEKMIANGAESVPHIKIEDWSVEFVKNEGAQFSYELSQGAFIDGRFQSGMEQSDRVTGVSYTREKMKSMPAATNKEESQGEAPIDTAVASEEEPEALEVAPSQKRGRTLELGPQEVHNEQQDSTVPSLKKHKTDAVHAALNEVQVSDTIMGGMEVEVVDEEQRATDNQQQPTPTPSPSRKRSQEPDKSAAEGDGANDEAFAESSQKKARSGSDEDAEGEADDEMADSTAGDMKKEIEDPNAVYCRCKQGDNGTEMVGCDGGDDCPSNGWVHWHCISSKLPQPGPDIKNWLCPDCDPMKKKKGGAYSWTKAAIAKGAAVKKAAGRKGTSAANKRRLVR